MMTKQALLVLLVGISLVAFPSMLFAAVTFEEKSFTLTSDFGNQESLEIQVRRPGTIRLAAKWSGAPSSLALILNGPGKVAAYDRKDGGSLLKLEYQVTQTDVLSGGTWTASIHNYSERGPVNGTLRAIVSSGPAFDYDFLGDYPGDREPGWSEECQGLAHDDTNWYISQRYKIWKFPLDFDLNQQVDNPRRFVTASIPQALQDLHYDHFGDPEVQGNRLFIPLENSREGQVARILVYNTGNLRYLTSAELPNGDTHSPWCAISPFDGLLYTSAFSWVRALQAFRYEFRGGQLHLTFDHELPLRNEYGEPMRFDRVQGGAFSKKSGLFYLANDEGTGDSGGIFAFDARSGIKVGRIWIDYSRASWQELEGITVWNLDGGPAPGVAGQIHMAMISNDYAGDGVDDLWIKHHRITAETALEIAPPSLQLPQFPPAAPRVTDAGDWMMEKNRLRFAWENPDKLNAPPVLEYQYRVRDRDLGTVRDWTSAGTTPMVNIELSLQNGHQYFAEVKSRNAAGWSEAGSSNGIIADLQPPRVGINSFLQTTVTLPDGRVYPNSFRVSLVGSDTGGSAFDKYLLTIRENFTSKGPGDPNYLRFSSPGRDILSREVSATEATTPIELSNLPYLYRGHTYALTVRGVDRAGNIGEAVSQDCVVRFNNAALLPPLAKIRILKGPPPKIVWEEVIDTVAGIAEYQVAVSTGNKPGSWHRVGNALEYELSKAPGKNWRVWVKAINGLGKESVSSISRSESMATPKQKTLTFPSKIILSPSGD